MVIKTILGNAIKDLVIVIVIVDDVIAMATIRNPMQILDDQRVGIERGMIRFFDDEDGVRFGASLGDEVLARPRPPVIFPPISVAAFEALADGERVDAVVLAEDLAGRLQSPDRPGRRRNKVENETVEIPGADEADSHRLFLFGQSTQANGASDRLDVFLLIAKKGCAVVR